MKTVDHYIAKMQKKIDDNDVDQNYILKAIVMTICVKNSLFKKLAKADTQSKKNKYWKDINDINSKCIEVVNLG